MSNIKIYEENKQTLSEISFVRNINNQIRISESKHNYDFSETLGSILVKVLNHLGIKQALHQVEKNDIKELILLRFKHLTLDEIDYAFKLERFGVFETKTEHFQLFNSEYVSTVLKKYENWKALIRKQHNISTLKLAETNDMTEQEKQFQIIEGCDRLFREYKFNKTISGVYVHIYDHLFKKGLLPTDKLYKDLIYAKAQVLAISEAKEIARENGETKKTVDRVIKEIEDKVNLTPVSIAKRLVLEEYFDELIKNNENLINKL